MFSTDDEHFQKRQNKNEIKKKNTKILSPQNKKMKEKKTKGKKCYYL